MAKFTIRVELHGANSEDYENLHSQMEKQGFSRTITADNGTEYYLPTAEYNIEVLLTQQEVLDLAKIAANRTKKSFAALVTESNGRVWYGLDKV